MSDQFVVPQRKITATQSQIVECIQHIGLAHAIAANDDLKSGTEGETTLLVALELDNSQ